MHSCIRWYTANASDSEIDEIDHELRGFETVAVKEPKRSDWRDLS